MLSEVIAVGFYSSLFYFTLTRYSETFFPHITPSLLTMLAFEVHSLVEYATFVI